nr:protein HEG-like isoform X2 [Paramormyrops kingsleyae]
MFSRLLTITWFIITIASAPMTADINTAISVTDPAESTVLPGTLGPPTSDTAQVSVDSVTAGYGTTETGLTDGYSPVSSSTLTETHSASPLTNSNWVSMDVITESEHNSLASSISPGSTSSSPVSSTVWVPMDVVTTAVYGPVVSATSPENNATIIESTSEYVAIETTTVRISTTSPVTPGFDLNTSTPKDMASSVTVEQITDPTHDHLVSSTSSENDTVPTKTPKSVTTDPELSTGFFSASTSESNFSNPVTNHVTMETATAHISIAPSTPKETYSTTLTNTALNSMETITVSPHKTVSPEMNSDGYGRTTFQTTMEAVTRSTNTAGVSLTKNESTTSYQVTIVNVTSTIYNPGVSQTSQEDDHSTTQVTQHEATTLVHNRTSSTSPENHYDTSVATSHHITMKTTVDMPTSTSTSLENYSTIPESTPNNNLTAFPTSENYFSTPASNYTAYIPVASSVTPAAGSSTPVGTSTETVTTSVYNPTKSTTSPTDSDTTFPQGPATTQGLESTSVTESPGQGTSEMSANQSMSTPVDQTSMAMTEISVTTVAGPTGSLADATSTMATVMSDQSTSSTFPTTTMSVPITNTGVPEQSSSSPIVPVTGSTTAPATTRLPVRPGGFCPSNPCPFNSVCLELITSFSCLCLAGSYFSGGLCIQARVFPGTLHIKTLEFQSEMSNRSSQAFQEMAAKISQELGDALTDQPGYVKTIVQELREGSVVASVDNIFKLGSNATKQSTISAIHAAIQDCAGNCGILTMAHFNATDLCKQEPAPCDLQTTNCVFQDNGTAKCICKEGYIPSLYSNTSCAACLSGERSENGKCVPCPFGYGGFNCHDSYLLAMVVISCVLGSLLLILLLAFISYCLRSPPKSSYNSPYLSDEMSSVWPQQDVTNIPRASSIWDPTQIEMMETANADSELGSKLHGNGATESCSVVPEDMRTFKGKNSSRYSYLIQGHQNPYFIADEMKITT